MKDSSFSSLCIIKNGCKVRLPLKKMHELIHSSLYSSLSLFFLSTPFLLFFCTFSPYTTPFFPFTLIYFFWFYHSIFSHFLFSFLFFNFPFFFHNLNRSLLRANFLASWSNPCLFKWFIFLIISTWIMKGERNFLIFFLVFF